LRSLNTKTVDQFTYTVVILDVRGRHGTGIWLLANRCIL